MENAWLINRKEIIRYLGYQGSEPDEIMIREIEECIENFLSVANPNFMYQVFGLVQMQDRLFTQDLEFEFIGNSIKKHLKGCDQVAFGCLTLSKQVDELIDQAQKEDMLHALIYDAIANAAVEEVRFKLEAAVAAEYKQASINWLFGIGYGDLELTLQSAFLDKIQAYDTIGVQANEKSILIPLKSVTGFIGISSSGLTTDGCRQKKCAVCPMNKNCMYKRET